MNTRNFEILNVIIYIFLKEGYQKNKLLIYIYLPQVGFEIYTAEGLALFNNSKPSFKAPVPPTL